MNSIHVFILLTIIFHESIAGPCPCDHWKPKYDHIDLNCQTKTWNISVKTYNGTGLCVKSKKSKLTCGLFRTFDHIPFEDQNVTLWLECFGYGHKSLCESPKYRKDLLGEAYLKNCSRITTPSSSNEAPVLNATSPASPELVIGIGVSGTLIATVIAGFLFLYFKKKKTLSSESSDYNRTVSRPWGSFLTIPLSDFETTDGLLKGKCDPQSYSTRESTLSERYSFTMSQIYSGSSVNGRQSDAASVLSVNSGNSQTVSVSSVNTGNSQTVSVSSVNTGNLHTVSVTSVNSSQSRSGSVTSNTSCKSWTGSVSSVKCDNMQTGSASSVKCDNMQTGSVSSIKCDNMQTGSASSVKCDNMQTGSASSVKCDNMQTDSVSSIKCDNIQNISVLTSNCDISHRFSLSPAHRTMPHSFSVPNAHTSISTLPLSYIQSLLAQRSVLLVEPGDFRHLSLSQIQQLRIETPTYIIHGPTPLPIPGPVVPLPKFD